MPERQKESPWAIIGAFGDELAELNTILTQRGMTDFVARLFIRVLFSTFDGYAYYVKQRALEGGKAAGVEFTGKELAILTETREIVSADGLVERGPQIVPTRESLTFALKTYGRIRNKKPPLVNGALPEEFKVASAVRNRITHPKHTADFTVDNEEKRAIGKLLIWWKEVMDWVRTEELQNIEEIKENIHESIQALIEKICREHGGTGSE
jgi:hypothetical protein